MNWTVRVEKKQKCLQFVSGRISSISSDSELWFFWIGNKNLQQLWLISWPRTVGFLVLVPGAADPTASYWQDDSPRFSFTVCPTLPSILDAAPSHFWFVPVSAVSSGPTPPVSSSRSPRPSTFPSSDWWQKLEERKESEDGKKMSGKNEYGFQGKADNRPRRNRREIGTCAFTAAIVERKRKHVEF